MLKILLPTDGSDYAYKAGEYAINAIKGANIIILYVINTEQLNKLHHRELREALKKELKEEGEGVVNKFKQRIEDNLCQGHCENVNFTTLIKAGNPAEAIIKTIEEEDINHVIMGKSGKKGMDKLYLGSTTEKVIRKANIPVTVIS